MTLRPALAAFLILFAAPVAAQDVSGAARVRDGDTLVVAGQPVRLQGLHCAETGEPRAAAATRAVRRLVADETVDCALTGARSYDRRVGRCSVGGVDLAARLIRDGVCARCPAYDEAGRYRAAQRAAGPWPGSRPGYCGSG